MTKSNLASALVIPDSLLAKEAMEDPRKLRELAGWYREFAERAGNPAIWHARLVTAKDLEREADRLEKISPRDHAASRSRAVELEEEIAEE